MTNAQFRVALSENPVIILTFHIFSAIFLYFLMYHLGYFKALPNDTNLLYWDGRFHYSIATEGYEYIPYNGTNLAFFPFFPLVWKFTSLSPLWMSLLNFILFQVSLYYLLKIEKIHWIFSLLITSIPSFIFFALPYAEAISFVFASLIVFGYKKNNQLLICIGLFGASFAKSASVIFIPAILICELFAMRRPISFYSMKKKILVYSIASLSGLLLAAIIQGVQTGQWFYFFEMQQFWGRHWIIPEFPLHTPVAFDGIAFIVGCFAIYICFKYALHLACARFPAEPTFELNKAVFFSALYLSATTILDTAFTYNMGGANIWSINRHLLCTPFAIYFLIWFVRDYMPAVSEQIAILVFLFLGIYLTGIYDKPMMIVAYLSFFTSLTVLKWSPKYAFCVIVIYLLQCFLQVQYFQDFISGRWVG